MRVLSKYLRYNICISYTKLHTAKEIFDEKDESSVAFINFDCVALINRLEAIVILDTGASSHLTPHQKMLRKLLFFYLA